MAQYPDFIKSTGYGTGEGLCGWNCRHSFHPYFPGIDTPSYTEEELQNIDPPPVEYNGKKLDYYQQTQKQRSMETAMRRTKREIIAAKAAGDDDMFTAKSVLLRRQREEYDKFSKATGLLTQKERTQVYGFDRSIAAKAAWAAKKADNNNLSSGKRKILTTPADNAKIKSTNTGSKLFTEENRTKMLQHERIISGNKYETAVVYNTDGSILFQKKGDSETVTFTRNQIKAMDGKVITHNHPNGSVFSPHDINIMRRGNLSEIRACNSDGAFVIRKSGKWSNKLTSLNKIKVAYSDCMKEVETKYQDIAAQEGKSILLYLDQIDYEGVELFCNRYNLELSWEDKL